MNKLSPVEVTGLIPLMRQSGGVDPTLYASCCGNRDCPYCDGSSRREVVAQYYMVANESEIADVILALNLGMSTTVRLTHVAGVMLAIVVG